MDGVSNSSPSVVNGVTFPHVQGDGALAFRRLHAHSFPSSALRPALDPKSPTRGNDSEPAAGLDGVWQGLELLLRHILRKLDDLQRQIAGHDAHAVTATAAATERASMDAVVGQLAALAGSPAAALTDPDADDVPLNVFVDEAPVQAPHGHGLGGIAPTPVSENEDEPSADWVGDAGLDIAGLQTLLPEPAFQTADDGYDTGAALPGGAVEAADDGYDPGAAAFDSGAFDNPGAAHIDASDATACPPAPPPLFGGVLYAHDAQPGLAIEPDQQPTAVPLLFGGLDFARIAASEPMTAPLAADPMATEAGVAARIAALESALAERALSAELAPHDVLQALNARMNHLESLLSRGNALAEAVPTADPARPETPAVLATRLQMIDAKIAALAAIEGLRHAAIPGDPTDRVLTVLAELLASQQRQHALTGDQNRAN